MVGAECRVSVKVRNNRILSEVEKCGYKTNAEFCRFSGIDQSIFSSYLNFKKSPVNDTGDWMPTATQIAQALGVTEELIFPEFTRQAIEYNSVELEMDHSEVELIRHEGMTREIPYDELKDIKGAVRDAIGTFPVRSAKVIKRYFGIGCDAKSLQEIAEEFGISRERARQIKDGCLRALRRGVTSGEKPVYIKSHKKLMEYGV